MIRPLRAFRIALAFLTIVRIPIRDGEITPTSLADARFAYPVVGLLIGLALAGLSELLRAIGAPAGPSAFLIVAAGVILGGGLHLDGLADTADGLFLWGDPDRRLAVMRDPRVGSFGTLAIVLVILGRFAVLAAMAGPVRSLALIASATIGRSMILVSAGLAPYARPEGTGRIVVEATLPRDSAAAAMAASAVGLVALGGAGLVATSFAILAALILTRAASARLRGVTGDILGAVEELGELAFLLVLVLLQAA